MMLKLYKFYWDCGRMGHVEGLFVSTEEEIKKAIGQDVYFGEILGKHSEIHGSLEEDDLELLSTDQEKIEWLVGLTGYTISGYNPLNYISDEVFDDAV